MNKFLIALGMTAAVSTAAFADTNAIDAYTPQAKTGSAELSVSGVDNDHVVYDRISKDGSPSYKAPVTGGIDYTPTASIGGVSNDQIIYDRPNQDGSPRFK